MKKTITGLAIRKAAPSRGLPCLGMCDHVFNERSVVGKDVAVLGLGQEKQTYD